ncbi:phage tail protein [Bacillaceae bacterium Marseille-Q3522]|nr:phage tail protein [Bacillaceae bacterium Marseille-Q3522]
MVLVHILDRQNDTILNTLNSEKGEFTNAERLDSLSNKNHFDFYALKKFDLLEKRNRLLLQDNDGFFHEFIINYAEQNKRNQKLIRSNASYVDLSKSKVIEPTTLEGATSATAVDFALVGAEWQAGEIEYTHIRTLNIDDYTNPLALLQTIAAEFELEISYRVEVYGNKVVGRYVDMKRQIAGFEGKEIVFGKDLIDVRRKEDSSRIVTALLGVGPERSDGTRLTVLVEDQDALQRWGRNGQHLIEAYEPQSTDQDMTEDRLRTLTENELEKRINAAVSYECTAASIEHIFGRSHEKIRKGQTVRIKDDGYTPPLYLEARIDEVKSNPITNRIVDFKIGNFVEYSRADLLAQISLLRKLMQQKADAATAAAIKEAAEQAQQKADQADEKAQEAAEVAASKRRNFLTQPIPPYDTGDTWTQGSTGDILTCVTSRTVTEAFNQADWAPSSKYTDDTTADEAKEIANNKPNTYFGAIAPEPPIPENSTWLRVMADGATKKYIYRNGQWVADVDADVQEARQYTADEVAAARQDLQTRIDTVVTNVNTQIDDINIDITDINTTVDGLNQAKIDLQQRVSDNETLLQQQGGTITTITQDVDELNGTMSTTITQLTALDGEVSQQRLDIDANASAISLKADQTTVNTLTGTVNDISAEVEVQAGQIALKANADSVYTKTETDDKLGDKVNLTVYNSKMAELDVSMDGISGRVADTETQINGINGDIDSINSDITTLDVRADGFQTSVTSLRTDLDGLQIGGRNLIQNSLTLTRNDLQSYGFLGTGNAKSLVDITTPEGVTDKAVRISIHVSTSNPIFRLYRVVRKPGTYTYSVWYKTGVSGSNQTFSTDICDSNGKFLTATDNWQKVVITAEVSESRFNGGAVYNFIDIEVTRGHAVIFYHPMLVDGNKEIPWSPAPEDTDTAIGNVQQYASSIDQKADSIELSVNTLTQTVDGHTSSISSADTRIGVLEESIELKAESSTVESLQGQVTSVSNQVSSLQVDVGGISTSVSDLRGDFDGMEIGSQNLLNRTGMENDTHNLSGAIGANTNTTLEFVDEPNAPYGRAIKLTRTDTNTASGGRYWIVIPKHYAYQGDKRAWSVYVKGSGVWRIGCETGGQKVLTLTDAWKKITHSFIANSSGYKQFTFYRESGHTGGTVIFHSLIMAEGTEVGNWSPSIADIDGQFSSMQTSIEETAQQIALKANSTTVDALEGRMSTAESELTVQADAISAKVDRDGVIAAINLQPGTARIQADKIQLIGAVDVLSDITGNLGTINTGTINSVNINGSVITGSVFNSIDPANDKNFIKIEDNYFRAEGEEDKYPDTEGKLYNTVTIESGNMTGTFGSVSDTGARTQKGLWEISNGGLIVDQKNYGGGFLELNVMGLYFGDSEMGTPDSAVYNYPEWDGSRLVPTLKIASEHLVLDGRVKGETVFFQNSYTDPRHGVAQALKVSGGIATDEVYLASGNLIVPGATFTFDNAPYTTHKRIRAARAIMKFMDDASCAIEFRHAADQWFTPIRAMAFEVNSTRESKYGITDFTDEVLPTIRSTSVHNYYLVGHDNRLHMGLIYDEAPEILKSTNTIDLYHMSAYLWKGLQEQYEISLKQDSKIVTLEGRLDSHDDEINRLKFELEMIKNRLADLEAA